MENKRIDGMNKFPFIKRQTVPNKKLDIFNVRLVHKISVLIDGIERKRLSVKFIMLHDKAVPQPALGNDIFHVKRDGDGNVDSFFYTVVR